MTSRLSGAYFRGISFRSDDVVVVRGSTVTDQLSSLHYSTDRDDEDDDQ